MIPLRIRDAILEAALPLAAFDGWSMTTLEAAARDAGYEKTMARAVFPAGVADVLDHFADYADRRMFDRLAGEIPETLRVRDRIRKAVMARMEVLQPFREAERQALAWWSLPHRQARGVRVLWRTADRIWGWAGDKAADYNRYTKRALLSGVIGATTLAWLGDDNGNMEEAEAFLDRRIENVMKWGNRLGRVKDAGGPWKIRREKTGNV